MPKTYKPGANYDQNRKYKAECASITADRRKARIKRRTSKESAFMPMPFDPEPSNRQIERARQLDKIARNKQAARRRRAHANANP